MIRVSPPPYTPARYLPWMLLGTVVFILLVVLLGILPLRQEAARADSRIRENNALIDSFRATPDTEPLNVRLMREQSLEARLETEWARARELTTFRRGAALTEFVSTSIEGRIDFKVALFEARQRIANKAMEQGIELPADLGIPETIAADEDTEKRLSQLATVVLLLEKCMEAGVLVVEHVQALSPSMIEIEDEEYSAVTFYPVFVQFLCGYDTWLELMELLGNQNAFFSLRHFSMTSLSPDDPDRVRVRAEWAGLVFGARPVQPDPTPEYSEDEEDWTMYE
jgi:hypothetical protein